MFGSDAEAALCQGIMSAFPGSFQVSCMRHLRGNVIDYLQNKVGCVANVRSRVLEAIFGPFDNGHASGGLLHSGSAVQYEASCQHVEAMIQDTVPGFLGYFQSTVKPILDMNHKCVLERSVDPDWTKLL